MFLYTSKNAINKSVTLLNSVPHLNINKKAIKTEKGNNLIYGLLKKGKKENILQAISYTF